MFMGGPFAPAPFSQLCTARDSAIAILSLWSLRISQSLDGIQAASETKIAFLRVPAIDKPGFAEA